MATSCCWDTTNVYTGSKWQSIISGANPAWSSLLCQTWWSCCSGPPAWWNSRVQLSTPASRRFLLKIWGRKPWHPALYHNIRRKRTDGHELSNDYSYLHDKNRLSNSEAIDMFVGHSFCVLQLTACFHLAFPRSETNIQGGCWFGSQNWRMSGDASMKKNWQVGIYYLIGFAALRWVFQECRYALSLSGAK